MPILTHNYLYEIEYIGDGLFLGRYLKTLKGREGLPDQYYQQLHRKAPTFLARDSYLFKRSRSAACVAGRAEQIHEIIRNFHIESGASR
jgi:hypothetical protein